MHLGCLALFVDSPAPRANAFTYPGCSLIIIFSGLMNYYKNALAKFLFCALTLSLPVHAAFLEMPDVTETTEPRTKSLLRDLDIPEVKYRSPDPTQGPRLAVSEFRVQGLVEYPELGITHAAISNVVEKIRYDFMQEDKLLESGYTLDELGELSDLLGDIEEEAVGRHVEPVDVQRLVWLVREQRGKRGITLGQIETVANTITQFYRERGFVLAKAYIPKQQVRDGIVNLTLLLGALGDVHINGNKLYRTNKLASVFDDMAGKAVTNTAIEERLYLINDYPGIFVDGYFEPGQQVGDTHLGVNVRKESRFNGNVRMDTHGSENTGRYRLYADAQINNPLGLADKFKLGVLTASQPSNTDYWSAEYHLKPFSPRFAFNIDASDNQFLVDQSGALSTQLNLQGDVTVRGATMAYLNRRTRARNSTYALRYDEIASDLQLGDIPDIDNGLDDKLKNISLIYDFDVLQERSKRFHQGRIKLTSGEFVYGADEEQKQNYIFLLTEYTRLSFLRLPLFNADTRLISRAELQYAGINLSGILRYSLAGPTRARAFAPGLFTADDAIFLGVDWIFNAPSFMDFKVTDSVGFRDLVKPVLFADYAYGQQNPLGDSETIRAQLADVGFGFKLSHSKGINGNLLFAFPVQDDFGALSSPPSVGSQRLVFDLQYSF